MNQYKPIEEACPHCGDSGIVTICLICKSPLRAWEAEKGFAVCLSCRKRCYPEPQSVYLVVPTRDGPILEPLNPSQRQRSVVSAALRPDVAWRPRRWSPGA